MSRSKIEICESVYQELERVAKFSKLSKEEVIKKGLKLMYLYGDKKPDEK